jgi:hypothetical protein
MSANDDLKPRNPTENDTVQHKHNEIVDDESDNNPFIAWVSSVGMPAIRRPRASSTSSKLTFSPRIDERTPNDDDDKVGSIGYGILALDTIFGHPQPMQTGRSHFDNIETWTNPSTTWPARLNCMTRTVGGVRLTVNLEYSFVLLIQMMLLAVTQKGLDFEIGLEDIKNRHHEHHPDNCSCPALI